MKRSWYDYRNKKTTMESKTWDRVYVILIELVQYFKWFLKIVITEFILKSVMLDFNLGILFLFKYTDQLYVI